MNNLQEFCFWGKGFDISLDSSPNLHEDAFNSLSAESLLKIRDFAFLEYVVTTNCNIQLKEMNIMYKIISSNSFHSQSL